jgi:hypothetical protein
MRRHLLADPGAQPAPDEEAGWLRLSARLTREVGRLADRDDLIVQAAPGAGRGPPGCFVPALATIEVDGRLLPAGVDPARARPRRLPDRERYPVLWGVLSHEAGHARHTHWQAPDDAPAATVAAAKLLEEPRAEGCQLGRRPGDRRWLRASATQLVLEGETPDEAVTPWAVAQAAALVLGRVDGGVLDPDGVQVGKGPDETAQHSRHVLGTGDVTEDASVPHDVRCDVVTDEVQLAFVEDALDVVPRDLLVRFRTCLFRHASSFFSPRNAGLASVSLGVQLTLPDSVIRGRRRSPPPVARRVTSGGLAVRRPGHRPAGGATAAGRWPGRWAGRGRVGCAS